MRQWFFSGTSDIRQFCEHGFYDWVMFRDDQIKYPDENTVLGRYLGPAIDVGPEMRSILIKFIGKFVHRSTYRGVNEDKNSNQVYLLLRKDFDNSTREIFGAINFTR